MAAGSPGPTRVAVIGAGFWSRFQLAAWKELPDAVVVAIANRSGDRARAVAEALGVPAWYADPAEMLAREQIDLVDVITAPDAHGAAIRLSADLGIPVICQKPLAPELAEARAVAAYCEARGVPLFVHESSRWQAPTRELARQIRAGRIGRPFRARLEFSTGFPVFDNQPFLRDVPRFILSDVGVHVLDVARFLFGEATSVSAITRRVHPGIKGEDVATVQLRMGDGIAVTCEMSFATVLADDPFPQTLMRVERRGHHRGDSGLPGALHPHRRDRGDRGRSHAVSVGGSGLRRDPVVHGRVHRRPAGRGARRARGGDHGGGQPQDARAGRGGLRVRGERSDGGPVMAGAPAAPSPAAPAARGTTRPTTT